MPPRKKTSSKAIEEKQFHIFDPEDVKQATEIPVKPKPKPEDLQTIEDVYEPYLMQIGFLRRTPRGRVAMPAAYKHLGKKRSNDGEQEKLL